MFDFSIPAGQGVPTGGTTGQVLQKNSSTNYDTSWITFSSLPSQTGNNGKYLTTDGSTASWATVAGGGQMEGSAAAKAIFWNAQTIGENITIDGTHNGWTVGPITVNNGFAVTVSNGARWVVF